MLYYKELIFGVNMYLVVFSMLLPCIFLMGPTAAGKTALALTLAENFPCEIISVDSAMVYRGMDIGTAKPDEEILSRIPHHLINICDPSQSYSAAQFCDDALIKIEQIQQQGKIPLLVGGTGLYFRSLQYGLSDLPTASPAIRQKLSQQAAEVGWDAMHQYLATIDPQAAQRIHPHDPQRIQRALEVYEISGRNLTDWFEAKKTQHFPYEVVKIIVSPRQRETLYAKIEQRFMLMLSQGLLEEVRQLFDRPDLTIDLPAIRAVGYRQVWQYLAGELDYANLAKQAIIATRQLAKRQLTWLRKESSAQWFDSQQPTWIPMVLKYLENTPNICRNLK